MANSEVIQALVPADRGVAGRDAARCPWTVPTTVSARTQDAGSRAGGRPQVLGEVEPWSTRSEAARGAHGRRSARTRRCRPASGRSRRPRGRVRPARTRRAARRSARRRAPGCGPRRGSPGSPGASRCSSGSSPAVDRSLEDPCPRSPRAPRLGVVSGHDRRRGSRRSAGRAPPRPRRCAWRGSRSGRSASSASSR